MRRLTRALARLMVLASWFYGVLAIAGGIGNGGPLVAAISMPVIWFIAVLAHEAGHVAIGVARGMTPANITVYPFELQLSPQRLRWVMRRDRRRLGGFVTFAPKPCRLYDRVAMIAAGPGANVVLTLLAAALFVRAGWPSLLGGEAVALMSISSSMAIANLLPHENSDGAKLLALWRWTRQPGAAEPA